MCRGEDGGGRRGHSDAGEAPRVEDTGRCARRRHAVLPGGAASGPDAAVDRGAVFMTASDCLRQGRDAGGAYQRCINLFVDEFRRSHADERRAMVADPIDANGGLEGLVAAVVSALCREEGMTPPEWVGRVASPEPFFAFPADSFAMRVRLMIEAP